MNMEVIEGVMQDIITGIQAAFKSRTEIGIAQKWDEGEIIESALEDCVERIREMADELEMDIE